MYLFAAAAPAIATIAAPAPAIATIAAFAIAAIAAFAIAAIAAIAAFAIAAIAAIAAFAVAIATARRALVATAGSEYLLCYKCNQTEYCHGAGNDNAIQNSTANLFHKASKRTVWVCYTVDDDNGNNY